MFTHSSGAAHLASKAPVMMSGVGSSLLATPTSTYASCEAAEAGYVNSAKEIADLVKFVDLINTKKSLQPKFTLAVMIGMDAFLLGLTIYLGVSAYRDHEKDSQLINDTLAALIVAGVGATFMLCVTNLYGRHMYDQPIHQTLSIQEMRELLLLARHTHLNITEKTTITDTLKLLKARQAVTESTVSLSNSAVMFPPTILPNSSTPPGASAALPIKSANWNDNEKDGLFSRGNSL